ncbi:MAG: diaminopimelate decarboxylase [Syntrophomonadaceae bacterium]|nr:diaminopimelate decarboxylase [Syntrophomonadaceae bacterium]
MKFHGTMKINQKGHLEIGGCDTVELVQEFGTPLYVMDEALIRGVCREYRRNFTEKYGNAEVIYASKAFLTTAMCRIIEEEDLGLDVVSDGELHTAIMSGFPPERIYFHGNNKSIQELSMALEYNIGRIVVDNFFEMDNLEILAKERGKTPGILLRVSPGIEAHTHEYIKTGQIDSKFGFTVPNGQAFEAITSLARARNLVFKGLHCHIGSQIFEMDSYAHTVSTMIDFIKEIKEKTGLTVEELNIGGGFGIYYTDKDAPASISGYAETVMAAVIEASNAREIQTPKIIIEPGRSIVGNAGTTLYSVGSIKDIPQVRKYVAVNGGMTDNIRPALYGARYQAMIANKAEWPLYETVSITGKCCESGDMLIWDIKLPQITPGDILAVSSTGAYGYTMSSNYNRLRRPAIVLVNNGDASLILRRETLDDLIRNDVIPDRLIRE